MIADVPLPGVPTFAIMQAHARITDIEEYERTRARVHADTAGGNRTWQLA